MKNYYKSQVGSHNTTLFFNIFHFIFSFWITFTENFVYLIFLVDSLEAKCLLCFNRYHCKSISLKKFSTISKSIISQIILSLLTVSLMGLITFLPILVFQILIIIPSLSHSSDSHLLLQGRMQSGFTLLLSFGSQFFYCNLQVLQEQNFFSFMSCKS